MHNIDVSNLGKKNFNNEKINQNFEIVIITKTKKYNYLVKELRIEHKDKEDFSNKENVNIYTKTTISFYAERFKHSFMHKDNDDYSRSIKIYTDKGNYQLIDFDLKHNPPSLHSNFSLITFEVDSRFAKVILIKTL